MTTIHTDKLMRDDDSDGAFSDDRSAALPARSSKLPKPHHSHASKAAVYHVHGGEDSYRACLLKYLDWIHSCGAVRDRASADSDTRTRLCPVTAYLQVILCHTPMEDWAAALTDPDPDASPLGFTWAWACRSPWIGARTAGIAVLVAMGCHVHRVMVDAPVRAEQKRLAAENHSSFQQELENEGHLCWAALAGVVRAARKRLQRSPSRFENYRRKLEAEHARELLAEVQNAADTLGKEGDTLGKEGERYAQLLAEKDGPRDRELEDVVVSIRTLAGFILRKAEPPVPRTVLLTVDGLATCES
ncbi:hypothetical protein GGX14DRAFT_596786 [Mycena pura]|uniref:Uncharacterized protein n=1 Tax=Mycena pura TaxID=153505 RepID=A0AAD6Y2W0_9AGAR|nr:hypothetical protein GGX14DRAFT_596786 [Mycena pura]